MTLGNGEEMIAPEESAQETAVENATSDQEKQEKQKNPVAKKFFGKRANMIVFSVSFVLLLAFFLPALRGNQGGLYQNVDFSFQPDSASFPAETGVTEATEATVMAVDVPVPPTFVASGVVTASNVSEASPSEVQQVQQVQQETVAGSSTDLSEITKEPDSQAGDSLEQQAVNPETTSGDFVFKLAPKLETAPETSPDEIALKPDLKLTIKQDSEPYRKVLKTGKVNSKPKVSPPVLQDKNRSLDYEIYSVGENKAWIRSMRDKTLLLVSIGDTVPGVGEVISIDDELIKTTGKDIR